MCFFYRKDDPEWHDEFIRIRGIRRREKLFQTVIGLITIVVLFFGWHGYQAVTAWEEKMSNGHTMTMQMKLD